TSPTSGCCQTIQVSTAQPVSAASPIAPAVGARYKAIANMMSTSIHNPTPTNGGTTGKSITVGAVFSVRFVAISVRAIVHNLILFVNIDRQHRWLKCAQAAIFGNIIEEERHQYP